MLFSIFLVIFLPVNNCYNHDRLSSSPTFQIHQESPFEETTDIRFLYQCVDQHNEYRRTNESSPLFVFNRDVENHARRRVTKMATHGKLLPPDAMTPFEEASAWTPGTHPVNCRNIVDHWFHQSHPFFSTSTPMKQDGTVSRKFSNSNITDFIWKRATELGCAQAVVHEPNQGVITVCNYYSPKFRSNKKFSSSSDKSEGM